MTKYDWLEEVEPGLVDILHDLNDAGFPTYGSCEGHLRVTGNLLSGYIDFRPGIISTDRDVREVSEIVKAHTNIPFKVLKGISRSGKVRFAAPLGRRPEASEAERILHIIRTDVGGPSSKSEKMLSMYNVEELEDLARRHRRWTTREAARL